MFPTRVVMSRCHLAWPVSRELLYVLYSSTIVIRSSRAAVGGCPGVPPPPPPGGGLGGLTPRTWATSAIWSYAGLPCCGYGRLPCPQSAAGSTQQVHHGAQLSPLADMRIAARALGPGSRAVVVVRPSHPKLE